MKKKPLAIQTNLLLFLTALMFFLSCSQQIKHIPITGPGLGKSFNIFSQKNRWANIVVYIQVDLSKMDTMVDYPTPDPKNPSIYYTPCVITISNQKNGLYEIYRDVKIRYKGHTTFSVRKKQFKVVFRNDNRFHGLRRINLHSEWKDATLIREKLVYDFFKKVGVIAPQANHIRLYIKHTGPSSQGFVYRGLYTAVEQVDTIFLGKRFGANNNKGNLYKAYYGMQGGHWGPANLRFLGTEDKYREGNPWARKRHPRTYRLKTNKKRFINNYSDLAALINVINNRPDTEKELAAAFNVDGFLKWLAANTLVGGWDNYWRNQQNYYLYNLNNKGKWHWIAWDYDNCMGHNYLKHKGYSLIDDDIFYKPYRNTYLIHKILSITKWKNKYKFYLKSFIKSYFNPDYMNPIIDAYTKKFRDYVFNDKYKQYSNKEWKINLNKGIITHSSEDGSWGHKAHHAGLKDYIKRRRLSVLKQLQN